MRSQPWTRHPITAASFTSPIRCTDVARIARNRAVASAPPSNDGLPPVTAHESAADAIEVCRHDDAVREAVGARSIRTSSGVNAARYRSGTAAGISSSARSKASPGRCDRSCQRSAASRITRELPIRPRAPGLFTPPLRERKDWSCAPYRRIRRFARVAGSRSGDAARQFVALSIGDGAAMADRSARVSVMCSKSWWPSGLET